MHLYINFHKLALTRGSSYTELPEWIKSKKAAINTQKEDEECFKWAVIEALHHAEVKHHPERISLKTNIIGRDLRFQYRLRRLISLKRTTLAWQ